RVLRNRRRVCVFGIGALSVRNRHCRAWPGNPRRISALWKVARMPGSSPGMTNWNWHSRLQVAFELVQEAPIRALGDDLLWARLYEAHIAHAQGVEPQRILGVVLAPFVIWKLADRLKG